MKALSVVPKKEDRTLMDWPHPYPIPLEDSFGGEDFLSGLDLNVMLAKLIDRHPTLFSHLPMSRIICLWKMKGGISKGKQILGKVQAATGLVGFFSEADFVIWLAADHLHEMVPSEKTVEACLFHEMCHIQWDAQDGKATVVDHDCAGFAKEVQAGNGKTK